MSKEVIVELEGEPGVWFFECPGCHCGHTFHTITPNPHTGALWSFRGTREKPTFEPSLLVNYESHGKKVVCHSFVRDGKIQFLGDCTHELRNKTVELKPII